MFITVLEYIALIYNLVSQESSFIGGRLKMNVS